MPYVFLVGGARCGKSAIALELLRGHDQPVTFVATAEERDEEMRERIETHCRERPSHWMTLEEPLELTRALANIVPTEGLVIDCLTLWVANQIEHGRDDDAILKEAEALAALLSSRTGQAVVVSNEVGSGLVPMEALSRRYRDVLGRANVVLAEQASAAALVVAGQVLPLRQPHVLFGAEC